jgi:hypothetical protein
MTKAEFEAGTIFRGHIEGISTLYYFQFGQVYQIAHGAHSYVGEVLEVSETHVLIHASIIHSVVRSSIPLEGLVVVNQQVPSPEDSK